MLGELTHMYPPQSPQRFSRNSIQKFAHHLNKLCHNLLSPSQHQKRLTFFCVGLCLFSLAALPISPASAQVTQAKVQEILDGNQVFIQNKQAALNDVAKQRQQVRTGNSRTSLVFNTGAVARLSANSVLQIGQCAQLKRGTILINGAVNACSSSITAGVRGTTYLLEVDESGNQQIKVLEGEVVVKRNTTPLEDFDEDAQDFNGDDLDNTDNNNQLPNTKPPETTNPPNPSSSKPTVKPTTTPKVTTPEVTNPKPSPASKQTSTKPPSSPPPTQPIPNQLPTQPSQTDPADEVVLKAGEKVEVSDGGVLGIVQELTENEFVGLLTGSLFQGFTQQIPGLDKIRSVFNIRFPNVNFPIPLPNIPGIPLPNIPSFPRFPF